MLKFTVFNSKLLNNGCNQLMMMMIMNLYFLMIDGRKFVKRNVTPFKNTILRHWFSWRFLEILKKKKIVQKYWVSTFLKLNTFRKSRMIVISFSHWKVYVVSIFFFNYSVKCIVGSFFLFKNFFILF